jgi:hypothetical protein
MAKKPTVVDLLQRIVTLLERTTTITPFPQPRVINDRFTDNGDGTITDKENKTLIIKDPSKIPGFDKTLTFEESKKACDNLSYAGYNSGWRMPTLKEEQSIRDYTRYEPAWNTDVFSGKHDDYYWTSTECAWNKDAAWCVGSNNGNANNSYKGYNNYVRPVRASQ